MSNTKYVLRTVVLALAGSVLVFLLVGLLLADHWQVTTTRSIPAASAQLAAKLVDLRSWSEWSEVDFELGNPTERECTGVAGKAEQAATWHGPMGIATVRLTRVEAGLLKYVIGYKYGPDGDSFGGRFTGSITWQTNGDATEVTWTERGELINLLQRWSNWFGALQEKVAQVQRASLAGLDEDLRRRAEKSTDK
jgi:hypothetical protein